MGRCCARQFLVDERQHPRETARVSALSRSRGYRRLSQAMCRDRGEGLRGLHPRLAASRQGWRCPVPPGVKTASRGPVRSGVERRSTRCGDPTCRAFSPVGGTPIARASTAGPQPGNVLSARWSSQAPSSNRRVRAPVPLSAPRLLWVRGRSPGLAETGRCAEARPLRRGWREGELQT